MPLLLRRTFHPDEGPNWSSFKKIILEMQSVVVDYARVSRVRCKDEKWSITLRKGPEILLNGLWDHSGVLRAIFSGISWEILEVQSDPTERALINPLGSYFNDIWADAVATASHTRNGMFRIGCQCVR